MSGSSSGAAFKSPPRKHTGDFKISKGAVVCSEAQLEGDISIGTQTVVHPSARLLAEGGPIVIGEGNLIQEQVTIINRKTEDGQANEMLVIGSGNVFEVGAYCESMSVGDNNTFEAKTVEESLGPWLRKSAVKEGLAMHGEKVTSVHSCDPDFILHVASGEKVTFLQGYQMKSGAGDLSKVGRNTLVSDRCVVGAACEVTSQETLPPGTVICGSDCRRYTKKHPSQVTNQQQLEYLIKVLPNFHHLVKNSQST